MRPIPTIIYVLATSLIVLVLAMLGTYIWQLHPWVPAGRAFALAHLRAGDFEFEAWQKKNVSITEPFADFVLVRQGTNHWRAFCFDIQDSYLPRVKLVTEKGQLVVYRDGESRGAYELETQTFRWHGHVYPEVEVAEITGERWQKK